jgi:hypothetical protein
LDKTSYKKDVSFPRWVSFCRILTSNFILFDWTEHFTSNGFTYFFIYFLVWHLTKCITTSVKTNVEFGREFSSELRQKIRLSIYGTSDLLTGTTRTGRVHPRRSAGRWVRRARVDGFFFKTVPYSSHTRARRGYTGTTGTDTGVLRHTGRQVGNGTGRRVKRYNGSVNRCNGSINRCNDLWNVITIYEML